MKPLILLTVAVFLLGGCSTVPKAQKGGSATVKQAGGVAGRVGPQNPVKGQETPFAGPIGHREGEGMPEATLNQPENPNQDSGQKVSYERETVTTVPTEAKVVTETVREDGSKVTVTETFPAGTQRREHIKQGVEQKVSGSWKDDAREIGVKLASLKPVQFMGALFLLGAAAMLHPAVRLAVGGGKTVQVAAGVIGLALIFGPVLIVGQEKLLLVLALAGAAGAWFISRLSHKEGQLDAKNETNPPTQP